MAANATDVTYALSAYQTDSGFTLEPEMVNHPDVYTVIEPSYVSSGRPSPSPRWSTSRGAGAGRAAAAPQRASRGQDVVASGGVGWEVSTAAGREEAPDVCGSSDAITLAGFRSRPVPDHSARWRKGANKPPTLSGVSGPCGPGIAPGALPRRGNTWATTAPAIGPTRLCCRRP